MEWIVANKEWIFSGVGIALISLFIWLLRDKKEKNAASGNQSISGVSAGRDAYVSQTISKDDAVGRQAHLALASLRQMPGRLQESVNLGATEFSFDEARKEVEKLFAVADADNNEGLKEKLILFQPRFNQYIELINRAIAKEVSLDEVNQYHEIEIVVWFSENVLIEKV